MWWTNCLAGLLVHLQGHMGIYNKNYDFTYAYPFKYVGLVLLHGELIGRNLNGEFLRIPNFGGLGSWRIRGTGDVPIETHHRLPRPATTAAVWPEFRCQIMPLQFDPVWGLG